MNNIEQKAIETFQNNMLYLQKEHPDTYKKVAILNQAIQSGKYKENFALEYRNGYFDILDLGTKEWLYGESSIDKSEKIAKDVNFRKDSGVIETFYNYSFDEKSIELAQKADPTISQFVLSAPVLNFTTNLIKKDTTMKKIYKFIFFGVGLGLHIEMIHKNIDAYMYLIIEDNLEIFRLSLFATDFSLIGEDCELYFCIMPNEHEFKEVFDKFYLNSFIRNGYIKYSLFYQNYRDKIAKIQSFIVSQSSNTYLQDKLLKKNARVVKSIKERYNFFNISRYYEQTIFSKTPVILIAAGPSLNKNIKWLEKNAQHSIVIALFMTLPILKKHNIKPDIVIHIDEGDKPVSTTLSKIEDIDFFSNCIYFLSPSVEMRLLGKIFKKESVFLFEDRTKYRFNKGYLESFSVGETMYALSLIYGSKDLYLLGLDLALDSETKKTHAEGHNSADFKQNLKDATSSETVSLRGSEFFIKGNFRDKVPTTPLFEISKNLLNTFTREIKKPYQKVYNLNDGAYFEGTIPIRAKDVDLSKYPKKDALETNRNLLQFFNTNSSSKMDKDELEAFKIRLEDAKQKREEIISTFGQKYPSIEQFQTAFVALSGKLISSPSQNTGELAQIYIIYLGNIGSHIGDFLNTREIDNPKREIKKFQKIISTQFLKIIDKYIDILNSSQLIQD